MFFSKVFLANAQVHRCIDEYYTTATQLLSWSTKYFQIHSPELITLCCSVSQATALPSSPALGF